MIGYQFNLHTDTRVEELGSMALVDDAEARAFGKQVIEDLLRKDDEHCSGWTLEITEGDRRVPAFVSEVNGSIEGGYLMPARFGAR
jgi:hypothetical protein